MCLPEHFLQNLSHKRCILSVCLRSTRCSFDRPTGWSQSILVSHIYGKVCREPRFFLCRNCRPIDPPQAHRWVVPLLPPECLQVLTTVQVQLWRSMSLGLSRCPSGCGIVDPPHGCPKLFLCFLQFAEDQSEASHCNQCLLVCY